MEVFLTIVVVVLFIVWIWAKLADANRELNTSKSGEREVSGESFHMETIRAIMADARPDANGWQEKTTIMFTIKAQPDNPHDPDAIEVLHNNQPVGHIPRDETNHYRRTYGNRLTHGVKIPGRIIGKDGTYGIKLRTD